MLKFRELIKKGEIYYLYNECNLKNTYLLIPKSKNFLLYTTEIKFLTTISFIISALFLKFLLP